METTIDRRPCIQYFRKRVYKKGIKFLAVLIKKKKLGKEITQEEDDLFYKLFGKKRPRYAEWLVEWLQDEFRHYHIAASILRGRTREQIEKPRENNLPNEKRIQQLVEKGEILAKERFEESREEEA